MKTTLPFSPSDMEQANATRGAMCGHGALAAALGVPVMQVMQYFSQAGWVNIPIMKRAIGAVGRSSVRMVSYPDRGAGVAMIQWLGSWMNEGVPPAARCAHRHWIAVNGDQVWDANAERWMPRGEWEKWVPEIYPRGVTGHLLLGVYILSTPAPLDVSWLE